MEDNIVELINRILTGDEEAFNILVRKYQKRIHALVWHRIGDFCIAEEITQDTFIQVYKILSTLRNPKLFDEWLINIANNLCKNWLDRNKVHYRPIKRDNDHEVALWKITLSNSSTGF